MNQRSALLIAAALTAFVLVLVGGLASRLSVTADTGATATVVVVPTNAIPPTEVVTLDPTVEAMIKEREAAYQQALAEANSRLSQANNQISQANGQISTLEQSRQQIADKYNQSQSAQESVQVAAQAAVNQAAAQAAAAQTAARAAVRAAAPVAVSVPAAAPAAAPARAAAPAVVAAPTFAISPDQAAGIALGVAAPGSNLTKAPELVSYEGTPAYEVVLDKGNVYVNAQSGAVMANGAAAPQLVSQDQAIQSAQAYIGGGTVKSVNLQDDNGAKTYQVQFDDDSKVFVDAVSGVVVYAEIRTNTSQSASNGGGSSSADSSGGGESEGGESEGGESEGGEGGGDREGGEGGGEHGGGDREGGEHGD